MVEAHPMYIYQGGLRMGASGNQYHALPPNANMCNQALSLHFFLASRGGFVDEWMNGWDQVAGSSSHRGEKRLPDAWKTSNHRVIREWSLS